MILYWENDESARILLEQRLQLRVEVLQLLLRVFLRDFGTFILKINAKIF
jgi:hypothetical protein